ncbi:ribonuclease P 40kDa subunit-domain-containing protein [Dipodascopsis uninucleata]
MSTSFDIARKATVSKAYATFCPVSEDQTTYPHTVITNHHFNRRIEIFTSKANIENVLKIDSLQKNSGTWQYYHVTTSMASFLKPQFLDSFIKRENCLILSLDAIDTADVFCIYNGFLRMSLQRETYEKGGLLGKQSKFSKLRYNVEYNLRKPEMVRGNKMFDRLVWALENTPLENERSFLVAIYSSLNSTAELQQFPADLFQFTEYTNILEVKDLGNVFIPPLDPFEDIPDLSAIASKKLKASEQTSYEREVVNENIEHILEWAGLLSLDSDRLNATDKIDSLLSTYRVFSNSDSEPSTDTVTKVSVDGFIVSRMVHQIFLDILKTIPRDSWMVFVVYGFQDAPVSWGFAEHSYLTDGDNDIIIVVPPSDSSSPSPRRIMTVETVGSRDLHC